MKPDKPCIDARWRARARLVPCSITDVQEFISAHYLHKRPGVVVLVLRVHVDDLPVGAVVFALPPKEIAARYGGATWELARLYLADSVPANAETWAIGRSLRYVKRHHPDVKFIVSYADPSAGHEGVIYRAANFTADGRTDEGRTTPRFDLAGDGEIDIFGDTRIKRYGRAAHVPAGVVTTRLPRVSKFRYVRAL